LDARATSEFFRCKPRGLLEVALILASLLALPPSTASRPTEEPGRDSPSSAGPTVARARFLMGTVFTFEAPPGRDLRATAEWLEGALDEVDRLERILSNWRIESEVSRLNREDGGRSVRVSFDLYEVIEASLRWARETGGAFDPTVEPLIRVNRSPENVRAPDAGPKVDRSTRLHGNWRGVELIPGTRAVRFRAGVAGIDLGGIGKGYALDRAAEFLRARGIARALLDAGGQTLALGAPPGEDGWRVSVADPVQRFRPTIPLLLRDVSVATSGNSERPSEIFDPAKGTPVRSRGSATAIALDATSADALSTALFVMGPSKGVRWARNRRDLVVIYLEPSPRASGLPRILSTANPAKGLGFALRVSSRGQKRRILDVQPW